MLVSFLHSENIHRQMEKRKPGDIMSDFESYKHRLIKRLHLPSDVFEGATILHSIGRYELTIENYKALLGYTDTRIRIQAKHNIVEIEGQYLEIYYFSNTDMKVIGKISSVSYV